MSEAPHRVRLRRAKGWRLPENTVVVARPGPWGNPYIVGQHGTAQECVDRYRLLLAGFIMLGQREEVLARHATRDYALAHLADLRGKNLACWCALDRPCHADVLLEAAAL